VTVHPDLAAFDGLKTRIQGLRANGILLHSPELSRHARPLNRYLRHEAGLGGRVRELAILTTARELDSQFEWAAHEPEALAEGISREIIEIIKHRNDTNGLDEADAVVIDHFQMSKTIFADMKAGSTVGHREQFVGVFEPSSTTSTPKPREAARASLPRSIPAATLLGAGRVGLAESRLVKPRRVMMG